MNVKDVQVRIEQQVIQPVVYRKKMDFVSLRNFNLRHCLVGRVGLINIPAGVLKGSSNGKWDDGQDEQQQGKRIKGSMQIITMAPGS